MVEAMRLTPEQISRLPENVVQAPEPPSAKDRRALFALQALLEKAVLELKALAEDPIVIASAPNRFNDAHSSEWSAIRFGSFFTEEPPYPVHTKIDYERDLARGPDGARVARRILDELDAANWRGLFSNVFDLGWYFQGLALAVQDGIPWLVFSASAQSEENHVFALWDEQPLTYFGECLERFDWGIQESPPLKFQGPYPSRANEVG
jgi:hypothetical protein